MNSAITIPTRSPEETRLLGQYLGEILTPGMAITLDGDLGSGKTTFTQGVGTGLGISDQYYITSPTYNLINHYPGRLDLFHIDLYRLADFQEIDELGLEEIFCGQGISVIEWPDRLPENILKSYLAVRIVATGEETRAITINADRLGNMELIAYIKSKY